MSKSKYKTKKKVEKLKPKKYPKKDMRRWSSVFFLIGLNSMIGLSLYTLGYKTFIYPMDSNSSGTASTTQTPPPPSSDSEEQSVLRLDAEQIENIVNTEAYTHAVWPGFKGKVTDGDAVRKHFSQNLAKIIVGSGGGFNAQGTHKVHFYYVVRDDGGIQFLALVNNGRTTENVPKHLIDYTQKLVNIGVPGIKPGTDVNGDPITVVYELVIVFKPGQ